MSNSGAAIEDTSPHHGTRRTKAPYAMACPGISIPPGGVGGIDRPSTDLRRTLLGKDRP
jgi:hypothetical protein